MAFAPLSAVSRVLHTHMPANSGSCQSSVGAGEKRDLTFHCSFHLYSLVTNGIGPPSVVFLFFHNLSTSLMKYPSSRLGYFSSGLLFQILTFRFFFLNEVKNNITCNSLCVCASFTKISKCYKM